jgi:hypothetical protein
MFRAFLALLFYFLLGRRESLEPFGNLPQHFRPNGIVIGDFPSRPTICAMPVWENLTGICQAG